MGNQKYFNSCSILPPENKYAFQSWLPIKNNSSLRKIKNKFDNFEDKISSYSIKFLDSKWIKYLLFSYFFLLFQAKHCLILLCFIYVLYAVNITLHLNINYYYSIYNVVKRNKNIILKLNFSQAMNYDKNKYNKMA